MRFKREGVIRFKREILISLGTPQRKRVSSRLEWRTWFFSSCGRFLSNYYRDLRDPIVWTEERSVSM